MTDESERRSAEVQAQLDQLRRRLTRIEFFVVTTFLIVLAQCAPYLSVSVGRGALIVIGGILVVVTFGYFFSTLMADIDQSPNRRNGENE